MLYWSLHIYNIEAFIKAWLSIIVAIYLLFKEICWIVLWLLWIGILWLAMLLNVIKNFNIIRTPQIKISFWSTLSSHLFNKDLRCSSKVSVSSCWWCCIYQSFPWCYLSWGVWGVALLVPPCPDQHWCASMGSEKKMSCSCIVVCVFAGAEGYLMCALHDGDHVQLLGTFLCYARSI